AGHPARPAACLGARPPVASRSRFRRPPAAPAGGAGAARRALRPAALRDLREDDHRPVALRRPAVLAAVPPRALDGGRAELAVPPRARRPDRGAQPGALPAVRGAPRRGPAPPPAELLALRCAAAAADRHAHQLLAADG